MAELILKNNVVYDQTFIDDLRKFKTTGKYSGDDKHFVSIARLLVIDGENITFEYKNIKYTIIPENKIDDKLSQLLSDPTTAVRGRDRLYARIKDLHLLGISRPAIMKYLERDHVHQTHQRIKHQHVHKPIITTNVLDRMQIDLIELQEYAGSNNRHNYVLTCIDCFSKRAWAISITQKKASNILKAIEPILREHTPKLLQSDNGSEFVNAEMEVLLTELNIKHVKSLPYKPSTNGQIERFNRTIKGMIMQHMATHNTRNYIRVLDQLITNYNNTYHTTIKAKPIDVFTGARLGRTRRELKKTADKEVAILVKTRGVSVTPAKIGDYVRINLIKANALHRERELKKFRKHFQQNYTDTVYFVEAVIPKNNSDDEYLLSESYIWQQGRTGAGKYIHGDKQLLNQIFWASELLVVPKPSI